MKEIKQEGIFVKRLADLMNEHNLIQTTLSQKTGIPRRSISNWFHGTKSPGADYLKILATYFKVSVDYLLGLEDEFGNKTYK